MATGLTVSNAPAPVLRFASHQHCRDKDLRTTSGQALGSVEDGTGRGTILLQAGLASRLGCANSWAYKAPHH
jgi:hypothetical protein